MINEYGSLTGTMSAIILLKRAAGRCEAAQESRNTTPEIAQEMERRSCRVKARYPTVSRTRAVLTAEVRWNRVYLIERPDNSSVELLGLFILSLISIKERYT
jgi:hypothetical protein